MAAISASKQNVILNNIRELINDNVGPDKRYRSQAEFSRAVGIDRQTINGYYNNKKPPETASILALCEKTGVSADWLLGLPGGIKYPDSTLQGAAACTGLSGDAVKALRYYTHAKDQYLYEITTQNWDPHVRYNSAETYLKALSLNNIVLSRILCDPAFIRMVDAIREYIIELAGTEAAEEAIRTNQYNYPLKAFNTAGWSITLDLLGGEERFTKLQRLDALGACDELMESIKQDIRQFKNLIDKQLEEGGASDGKHPEDDK